MDYINHIIQVILKNSVSIKRNILEIKIIANMNLLMIGNVFKEQVFYCINIIY